MNHHTTHETHETHERRSLTRGLGLGLGAGLLAGGAIGLLGVWPGSSSAADTGSAPSAIVVPTQDDTTDDTTTDDTERGARLRELLQPLVDDGTIDAAQADAVAAHLVESRIEQRIEGGPMSRPHGGLIGHGLDTVADTIGIDVAALGDELRAGSTIADVATANGVDPQAVVDALVADAQEHLDAAVENGRLDQAEADERAATLEDRITDRVNGDTPSGELREWRERRDRD